MKSSKWKVKREVWRWKATHECGEQEYEKKVHQMGAKRQPLPIISA